MGDTIPINYNNKKYFIDIIEARPGDAISVIETDCNVRGCWVVVGCWVLVGAGPCAGGWVWDDWFLVCGYGIVLVLYS